MLLNFWVNIGMWPIISTWVVMPDTTMMSEYTIYMVWKLIAMFCPITSVTSMWQFWKLVVTGQLNNAEIHVQMKFWKFENCTFRDITSSNVDRFSSNLQNRHSFIQTILTRGRNPMLTPKLHMSEIWSKSKKWNISLNFWVNIGMWPIISMQLTMPDATVMSEYMIYMVWKLVAMFCPITCVTFIWQFRKLVVTGLTQQCWDACTNEILEIWKFMFCEITSSNVDGFSSNLQNWCSFIQTNLTRGKALWSHQN